MNDYSLEDLEALTGIAKRTIRFYIQKGLVEAPFGARKTPQYTEQHLTQLYQIKLYKESGLNLRKISDLLNKSDENTHTRPSVQAGSISLVSKIHLVPGVNLEIDQNEAELTDTQLRKLAAAITETINTIKGNI